MWQILKYPAANVKWNNKYKLSDKMILLNVFNGRCWDDILTEIIIESGVIYKPLISNWFKPINQFTWQRESSNELYPGHNTKYRTFFNTSSAFIYLECNQIARVPACCTFTLTILGRGHLEANIQMCATHFSAHACSLLQFYDVLINM